MKPGTISGQYQGERCQDQKAAHSRPQPGDYGQKAESGSVADMPQCVHKKAGAKDTTWGQEEEPVRYDG